MAPATASTTTIPTTRPTIGTAPSMCGTRCAARVGGVTYPVGGNRIAGSGDRTIERDLIGPFGGNRAQTASRLRRGAWLGDGGVVRRHDATTRRGNGAGLRDRRAGV